MMVAETFTTLCIENQAFYAKNQALRDENLWRSGRE